MVKEHLPGRDGKRPAGSPLNLCGAFRISRLPHGSESHARDRYFEDVYLYVRGRTRSRLDGRDEYPGEIVPRELWWTPLSRSVLARNKLIADGVFRVRFGAAGEAAPPFRRLIRRLGRIPAEPCPPFKCLQRKTNILARKR
jgi:hypothetical protein